MRYHYTLPDGRVPLLDWDFDGQGTWQAFSRLGGEQEFSYRIEVCNDGTFDVTKTDHPLEVRKHTKCFHDLPRAVEACESCEKDLVGK